MKRPAIREHRKPKTAKPRRRLRCAICKTKAPSGSDCVAPYYCNACARDFEEVRSFMGNVLHEHSRWRESRKQRRPRK